jgi:hypothetical protein
MFVSHEDGSWILTHDIQGRYYRHETEKAVEDSPEVGEE